MGWFGKKKENKQPEFSSELKSQKQLNIHTIIKIDETVFNEEEIKNEFLCRPTKYLCPVCHTTLYDITLDGNNYFCTKCNIHLNKSIL